MNIKGFYPILSVVFVAPHCVSVSLGDQLLGKATK